MIIIVALMSSEQLARRLRRRSVAGVRDPRFKAERDARNTGREIETGRERA
jgi:hypothetical protein